MMDRLWAPWRIRYIKATKGRKKCVFCQAKKIKRGGSVVFRTRLSLVILNAFPYNNGHLMVSPLRHIGDINMITEEEALDLFRALKKTKEILQRALRPHGYNIGLNLGKSAGVGISGHLHIHIVPRWQGDANFMTVSGGTRVISQSLKELHRLLKSYVK